MPKGKRRMNIYLTPELNEWLEKRAGEIGISKSALVVVAVEEYKKTSEAIGQLPLLMEVIKSELLKGKEG